MSSIKKEKNVLEFWVDGKSAPYKLDINTGIIYGLRGMPIKSSIPGIRDMLRSNSKLCNVTRLLHSWVVSWGDGFPKVVQRTSAMILADRLESIGYTLKHNDIWMMDSESYVASISKVFNRIAPYMQEHTEDTLSDFLSACGEMIWREENNLAPNEHLTENMIHDLWVHRNRYTTDMLPYLLYWMPRGLYEYYIHESVTDMFSRVSQLFRYANLLGWTVERKSDFFRQYVNVSRSYYAKKDELDKIQFTKAQHQHLSALQFENDQFVVVIPTSAQELIDEGEKQHNCVGSYGDRILRGGCNVVFIRKKDSVNQPYITCEICERQANGQPYINQYLQKYNGYVRDVDALAFEKVYLEHLRANW